MDLMLVMPDGETRLLKSSILGYGIARYDDGDRFCVYLSEGKELHIKCVTKDAAESVKIMDGIFEKISE
jgi:hypothetical protein